LYNIDIDGNIYSGNTRENGEGAGLVASLNPYFMPKEITIGDASIMSFLARYWNKATISEAYSSMCKLKNLTIKEALEWAEKNHKTHGDIRSTKKKLGR
jgi:hypothetical protein